MALWVWTPLSGDAFFLPPVATRTTATMAAITTTAVALMISGFREPPARPDGGPGGAGG